MYTCIYVNLEHTLVKQGGRGVLSDTEDSVIKYDNNNYNIRLCNTECYTNANIIFDYSIPNIINTKTSKYSVYYKSIYVPHYYFRMILYLHIAIKILLQPF